MAGWDDVGTVVAPPPKTKGWDSVGKAVTPPAADVYAPTSDFREAVDKTVGKGKWRDTGDYRSPAREEALRLQGAGTVAPGHTSNHSRGAPDAPGAHDIVAPGLDPKTLDKVPGVRDAFYEGRSGSQGGHIHVDMRGESPSWEHVGQPVGQKATPAAASWDSVGAPVSPAAAAPSAAPPAQAPSMGQEIGDAFTGARKKLVSDVTGQMQRGKGRTSWGDVAQTTKDVWDLVGQPVGAAFEHAIVRPGGQAETAAVNATAHAINPKARPMTQEQGEHDINQALWAFPGEGEAERAVGAARRAAPAARLPETLDATPKLPKTTPKAIRPPRTLAAHEPSPAESAYLEAPATSMSGIKGAAHGAQRAVQSTFGASTMSDAARDTAAIVRRSGGESAAVHAQTARKLLTYDKVIGRLPVVEQRALVDYIEGVGDAPKNPELKSAADAVAQSFKSYKDRISYVLDEDERPNFLENYYSHMWQDKPSVVADKMNSFYRQGSGRSFKARSIPTMRDGIEAGLTPKTENPIEVAMTYSGNMQRYLHTLDVQSAMTKDGLAKMFPAGQPPEGWVPLEGIRTREGALAIQNADKEIVARRPEKQLYAPEDAARIYNRSISRGFESGDTGPWWETARKASNSMTAMKLGLSAYHAVAETLHAHASDLSRGLISAARGRPIEAAKSIGPSLIPGASATRTALKGAALRREILAEDGFDNLSKTAKAYVQSGGRVKMDSLYSATSRRTFYQALKNKTFGLELNRAMESVYKGSALDRAKGVASLAANTLQSAMGPLFEDYIPNLKAGAFQQRYADWLEQNPKASRAQADNFARQLSDHMDNRFGEMVYDNLFWHKQMKQTAQLLALAPGWDIGLLRELAGGVLDVPKSAKMLAQGKGPTDKTAYLVSLLAMGAYANGVMTYLKTGTAPKGRDFLAYRTGGQAQSASGGEQWDERGQVPGQQKDVYAQIEALSELGMTGDATAELQDLKNKGAPWLDALSTIVGNSNWRGDPVIAGVGVQPQEGDKNLLGSAALDAFMPITLGQFKKQPGSNISPAEKLAGMKRAPKYLSDPDDYFSDLASRNQRRYSEAQKHAQDAP